LDAIDDADRQISDGDRPAFDALNDDPRQRSSEIRETRPPVWDRVLGANRL
jgi:hypothetical protein